MAIGKQKRQNKKIVIIPNCIAYLHHFPFLVERVERSGYVNKKNNQKNDIEIKVNIEN